MMQSSRISSRRLATIAQSWRTTTTTRNSSHLFFVSRQSIHGPFRPQQSLLMSRKSSLRPSRSLRRSQSSTTNENNSNTSTSEYVSQWIQNLRIFLAKDRIIPIPRWISPQYSTTTMSEVFGHSSFLLVAISYVMEDFMHLRLTAIAGSSAMLVFTYFHPHGRVLWLPFKWNAMFILINTYRVMKVKIDTFFARQMDELMLYMHDHHFYVMDMVDYAELIEHGTRETYKKGEAVVKQGENNRYVRLVLRGELNVQRDGITTYTVHQGNFISESGMHAGLLLRGNVNSCCSVIADTDTVEVLKWDRTELMYLMEINKNIQRALKAVMSWDIVNKLKSQRNIMSSGELKDPELWSRKRREQTLHRYKGILKNIVAHPAYLNKRKDELAKYRDIHHISEAEHEQTLAEMGWTLAEFDVGKKEGQFDEDLVEPLPHDWKAYFYQLYLRLTDN